MSRVERHAVLFFYGGVKGALHVVNGLRDEVETELPVAEEVVEQAYGQLLALCHSFEVFRAVYTMCVIHSVSKGRVRRVRIMSDT